MRTYLHDRLLARSVLPLVPRSVHPNHITVLRLLLTPLAVWLVYTRDYVTGIPFFLLVAFTDALDGSLARVRNQVTEWGMVWDPIADKTLIGSVAVVLLLRHFPAEITIAVFGLEAAFLIGGYYWKRKGRIVSANIWGKFKMVMQVAGVTLFLLWLALGFPIFVPLSYFAFGLAMIFAIMSLVRHGL